jgi:carboxyl-terminal processing protease
MKKFGQSFNNDEFSMEGFMKRMDGWKRVSAVSAIIALVMVSFAFVRFDDSDADYFLKINKSIDIFGRVYREVTMNYVDEVDPGKFMEAGIDGLLSTLDPYTNYIDETEGDEVELLTSGKYGGIGVTIGLRDGKVTVLSVMEGYSAQRQGIQPGDRILAIEGKEIDGMKPDNVRSLTRGEPGTEVHLRIEREGEPKPLEFVLVREEIQLHNVSYAGFIDDGIGYVRIDRFSRGAGDELRLAIKDMKIKGAIKGFILDLRDNPGGLLDVAVDVVEKFAPKGSPVVSTRGRHPDTEKKYYVTEEPILPDVPLVVLVNRNSASASEIVAGAIQDLDRGVILGARTFGKGLVQTITPLAYNTQLKITTAKYYTPSGRCIQEIDYQHKNNNGVFAITPDSLRHSFKTLKGRKEFESGGIQPDTIVTGPDHSVLYNELLRKSMFLRFAVHVAAQNKTAMPEISDDSLVRQFRSFIEEQHFTYQNEYEAKLKELHELVLKSKANDGVLSELDKVETMLAKVKANDFSQYAREVLDGVKIEMAGRYKGDQGRIEASFGDDLQLNAAKSLLKNLREYSHALTSR